MDNVRKLEADVTFNCEDCDATNSVYTIRKDKFKYIHKISPGIWACRVCGAEHEIEGKYIVDYANN